MFLLFEVLILMFVVFNVYYMHAILTTSKPFVV